MLGVQENERLAAEVEVMRAGPSPLEEARVKHQEHVSDREKFRKLLDNLQVPRYLPLYMPAR